MSNETARSGRLTAGVVGSLYSKGTSSPFKSPPFLEGVGGA